ncbi:hypothetical protein Dsin_027704 [Dipteronia sinensis]|uniref:Pectinesterase inhibitor domain-containing protein n=1 Tax=Dipteronia sinensis TaxID=43782 RepID=A0AAD9ZNZ8_9ROSI|nr:hypothetical protein Dsin_027704 [Dipteronia sinensis]
MVFFFLTIQVSAHDLINDTCKKTHFYDLCVTTLRSDPQSSKADVQGLARIALAKLLAKANDTLNHIDNLFSRRSFRDVHLFDVLYACSIEYNDMVYYDLPVAIHGLAKGNATIAETSADLIATDAHTCGKGLKRYPKLSQLVSENKLVRELSLVVKTIIKILL